MVQRRQSNGKRPHRSEKFGKLPLLGKNRVVGDDDGMRYMYRVCTRTCKEEREVGLACLVPLCIDTPLVTTG
ncbi:hypothetical protein ANTQUA_LOCUS1505 [Anthophora quadrimaculata]